MSRHNTLAQYGSGISDIGTIYRGPHFVQRGRGIGSIFAGLWKHLIPLARSGLKTVGKQSLKTVGNVLHDLSDGKNLKGVLINQGEQAINELTRKGMNKLQKMQRGEGLLTHTLSKGIKAGDLKRKMIVGHSIRPRKKRLVYKRVKVEKNKKNRRSKIKTLKKQFGGRRKKRVTKKRKFPQKGGKQKRKKTKNRTKKTRKTTRSIDIFDF